MARRALAEAILTTGANRAVTVPATSTLRVRERGGTALATIYSASTGGTALPNPLTVTNGMPVGYVENGSYDLMATASGVDSETWEWEALVATSVVSTTDLPALAPGGSLPQSLETDVDVDVLYGTTSHVRMVQPTSLTRKQVIVKNTTAHAMKVATGTLGTTLAPSAGFDDVEVGEEYVTSLPNPIWVYVPTAGGASAGDAAGYVRVYQEQSA